MDGWKLDTKRFADEVFVPVAREDWDVGSNLFRFFQLPIDICDDALIEQAVRGVDGHLKRSSLAGVHANVASTLRHGFTAHATTMRETARRDAHRRQVLAERRLFVEHVRADMREMPALQVAALDELAGRWRAQLVRREIEELIAEAGIAVRDPVELVAPPLPSRWSDVRLSLRTLGQTDLWDFLGSRRLGPDASPADVRRVREALDRTGSGDALIAEEKVLTEIGRLASAGALADALRRELVDELANAAERGRAVLDTALARPDVRRRIRALGLPDADELGYALLCRASPAGAGDARWRDDVQQAVVAREPRTALDILEIQGTLPADMIDLRDRLRADMAAVTDGLAAAAALEATDPEGAASRYLSVLRIAREAEAEAGLRRCRPPAPPSAGARVEGDRVVITWESAPVRAGDPAYKVVRRVDHGPRAGRTELAATPDLSVVDTDAPAGVPVHYEVSTVREGATSGWGAGAGPVVVLRAVSGVVAEVGDGEVRLRWRLPDGAVGVRLRRSEGGRPVDLPAGTTAAHDTGVTSGRRYTYSIEAAYASGHAAAVTVDAHPQRPPAAVDDLVLTDEPNGVAVVRWTPPDDGDVVLRLDDRPPPAPGTILMAADADLGAPVRVLRRDPDGARILLPADGRRRWLVPITVSGEIGVVGDAVERDGRLPAVKGLRAVRQGNVVRLSWEWPPRAGEARVLVREGGPVDGALDPAATVVRISRAVYDQAGCRVPHRPGVDVWVAVGLTAHDDAEPVHGPLRHVGLPARSVAHYTIRPGGWGRWQIVVSGSPGLPRVQLRCRVTYPPLRRDEGVELVTVQPENSDATTMTAEFDLPRGRPLHLRAYADPDSVELVPEDPEQLCIDRRRWW
jgi:hypothetical protein